MSEQAVAAGQVWETKSGVRRQVHVIAVYSTKALVSGSRNYMVKLDTLRRTYRLTGSGS